MINVNSVPNGKDSRWLQLEVCREFQRNKCTRTDTDCKFAHPPANVEVLNGRVTACYDSIKGRCNREKPPCKYFHPPQHLKDQLLINGRNHLALKNALMQQINIVHRQPVVFGQVPNMAATPYYSNGIPVSTYSPYYAPTHIVPTLLSQDPSIVTSTLPPVVPQTVPIAQKKYTRCDREVDIKSNGYIHHDSYPSSYTYKKPTSADKSPVPTYQPSVASYQQMQQPYVLVSYATAEITTQGQRPCRYVCLPYNSWISKPDEMRQEVS